jgi:predicted DNA-binding transcriptional regulator YafY
VLSVLELLQAHGQLSAPELAERLEVDVRTVRRYIVKLQDMGIPIEAEIGRYGGYSLRPGFKLPPLMFTDDEVLILTLGLHLARHSDVIGARATADVTLAKLGRVLPMRLRDQFMALTDTLNIAEPPREATVEGGLISTLSLAIQQCRQVRVQYGEPDAPSERVVDPYTVICYQARWYMVGYCHLRQARRTFRLDRMRTVSLLDSGFDQPDGFDGLAYMLESFAAIPDRWDIEVLLTLPMEAARLRIPHELAILVQEADKVRLRSSMPDLDYIARVLIGLACPLNIIAPDELRSKFLAIAAELTQVANH